MGILDWLTGKNKKEQINEFLAQGATIIDVRTPEEFARGAAQDSVNIPLASFEQHISSIKQTGKPVILVCRSGARAGAALQVAEKKGLVAMNAGRWQQMN